MECWVYICIVIAVILLLAALPLLKLYIKLSTGWCHSKTSLVGKTAIVTGANVGIGYETAKDFAMRGGRVILACRDPKKAEDAKKKIIEETGNENIVVKIVDMVSFDSVRKFAKDINASENRLDILVNNAGLGSGPEYTEEGNVFVYQVNYFSHFLLTILLIGLLKKSKPSRIVNVSSSAAQGGSFDINKLGKHPGGLKAYSVSKLLQILFTKELAKRLDGSGVSAYSLHPGAVRTEFLQKLRVGSILRSIFGFFSRMLFKTTVEGAQTTLHASLEKDLEKYSGQHFSDCKPVEYSSAKKVDSATLEILWEKTGDIVHLTPEEKQILV